MTNKRKSKDDLFLVKEKYNLLREISLAIAIRCEELPEDIIEEFCYELRHKIFEAEDERAS